MPDLADLDLHPGVRVSLSRYGMDEAQVARAMATGDLSSPQQFGNGWLFNVRITGTGAAYRSLLKETVWRDPDLYMNQGFLDRCQGLPVIIEHPDKLMLDSGEFSDRVVGMIVYPYLKEQEEEVWGISRILNQRAAKYMREHQLSTSPAVVFRDADDLNERGKLGGGESLLIEGKPSLLDHLAICSEGVWDKGGPATGVDITGERKMADEDKRTEREKDEARGDADGEKLDKLLSGLDSMSKRMDALEGRRDEDAEKEAEQAAALHKIAEEEEESAKEEAKGDAEDEAKDEAKARKEAEAEDEERDDEDEPPWKEAARKEGEKDGAYSKRVDAMSKQHPAAAKWSKRDDESIAAHCDRVARDMRRDSARRDAEETASKARKEAEEARADAAQARRDARETRKLLEEMKGSLADRSDDDEATFADAQARADDVYMALGGHAPRAMRGEDLLAYRARLARGLQTHSRSWKEEDLPKLVRQSPTAFTAAESAIYADAAAAARDPSAVTGGEGLRKIIRRREGGGEMYEWAGDPLSWMSDFMPAAQYATRLGKEGA